MSAEIRAGISLLWLAEGEVGLVSDSSRRKHNNHHSAQERGQPVLFLTPALSVFSGLSGEMKTSQAGPQPGKTVQMFVAAPWTNLCLVKISAP